MTVLLLSGAGPAFKYWDDLRGSLFDAAATPGPDLMGEVRLDCLKYRDADGHRLQLLRPKRDKVLYLVTYALQSILHQNDIPYESFALRHVWEEDVEPSTVDPEAVLLSTSFICNRRVLTQALRWVRARYPNSPLVVGGQFTNLKYLRVMQEFPEIDFIVRGDGEDALPGLLDAVRGACDFRSVPNLVWREQGQTIANHFEYVDIDVYPPAIFPGDRRIIPYESMRGCPFNCRFCSYPAASPTWRYKSASKIRDDWIFYSETFGRPHIQALDSTFTVPKPRLRELLPLLNNVSLTWEAYSRANALHRAEVVDALESSHCTKLSIGFESMSDVTLGYMHKQVRAKQNETAHDLLRASTIQARMSFMVGYPGETPADFVKTSEFITSELDGHFMLSVFSFTDETMPVWEDADRFSLEIEDLEDPDSGWRHVGMDVDTAKQLRTQTIRRARWNSESAVWLLWQAEYETPLVPGSNRRDALRQEKLVERLAMLPVDFPRPEERDELARGILAELRDAFGVEVDPQADTEKTLTNHLARQTGG